MDNLGSSVLSESVLSNSVLDTTGDDTRTFATWDNLTTWDAWVIWLTLI